MFLLFHLSRFCQKGRGKHNHRTHHGSSLGSGRVASTVGYGYGTLNFPSGDRVGYVISSVQHTLLASHSGRQSSTLLSTFTEEADCGMSPAGLSTSELDAATAILWLFVWRHLGVHVSGNQSSLDIWLHLCAGPPVNSYECSSFRETLRV